MFVSPAQGAVFAPLALKFVLNGPSFFFIPDYDLPHSVPVQTIDVNWTSTATATNLPSESPPKKNANTGAIAGGIAAVVAIFAAIGIATFGRRRWGWRRHGSRPKSVLFTDSADEGPQIIMSPFYPDSFDANRDSGISAEQQPLVVGDPEADMVTPHRLSFSPPAVLPRQVAPAVPAGLSDKELARLRAEGLSSPQAYNFRVSALRMPQPTSPPNDVTEPGGSSFDTRRLHTEFESLRREVEQLRAEGLVVAAPPSYAEGDV